MFFLPFHDDNATRRPALVTYALVGANVLIFLWFSRLPSLERDQFTLHRGFIPHRIQQLYDPRPIVIPQQILVEHRFWGPQILRIGVNLEPDRTEIFTSLLTCMFLHAGWLHLIFNMWFLWLFGNNVEDRLGPFVFLLFYVAGGVMASACHWAIHPTSFAPVIGASGAVAAVLGAYAITWPWARIHTLVLLFFFLTVIDVPALVVLGAWFVGQLIPALNKASAVGGVAWWAHVGGFLAGMALMPLLGWFRDAGEEPSSTEILEE